jgi:CO/xanthine dehydrogenase Mo-binding subunit
MKKLGIGIASAWQGSNYHYGAVDQATLSLELTDGPRLRVGVAAADLGQGSNETICQIVSNAFYGFPIQQIDFLDPDTTITPDGGPTGASRFTEVTGSAALKASQQLLSKIQLIAAEMLDTPPGDIRIEADLAHGQGDSQTTLAEVVKFAEMMGMSLRVTASHQPPPTEALDEKGQGYGVNQFSYATYVAEVEVDTDTGEVRVLKVSTFLDAGKIIRLDGAEMQVDGGLVMGLGHALTEDIIQTEGKVETDGFATYLIPSVYDVPAEISYDFVDEPVSSNELGAKGMAELTMVPIIPAIINAIYNAVGIRITQLPATPERILLALNDLEMDHATKGRR